MPREGADGCRIALSATRLWISKGSTFNAASVAAAGAENLADSKLQPVRLERLRELARTLDVALVPGNSEIADFAERHAGALASGPFEPPAWADFFDDLALELSDGAVLEGRLVLIDEQRHLLAASSGKEGAQLVFVGPSLADDSVRP